MKTIVNKTVQARPRGRPRNLELRAAILDAARALLDELGPSGVTMEALAAKAGVGKPTVYRWWPDRHAVTMAALMEAPAPDAGGAAAQAPLQALAQQLQGIVATLASRTGRNVATLIAAADPHTELSKAFRNHFVLARRTEGRALLLRAVAAGEVRADLDLEVALDLIYGPLFFRLLLGHAPLDAAFAASLAATLLRGLHVTAA
ncbi:TetR/AcrR family transcriptional regulator [Janthinobacterium fluminis]|uniref:TetR/AcrR family transcriptional regulator n=1 Tax=Janthinobacterium fluminis TaxID=2987524 RepID=A0ABT5JXH0_9BURK|nr:TetR/AcrR family transcriptional regulator [Janthinobacterium fluminis]MDC8756850.1 TetR/AcrR family transcriptional regulator [Janthinobacterium fluminis]